ncbi:uncharacterized protein LOC110701346 [Chenopodium quinoa]|uniref:uncharacterized protein LOC110701346 n=1 Tax=Chenopodium quinoa TaxID=63459 RepID=UPI000B77EAF4|nr:uncharacterized protein LOC110701346 [Chenopodium quinoa]
MYVKVENTRLDFFRRNQQTIRADLYQGFLDTIGCGEECAANVGKRVIFPATFIGGPRDLKKRYLNAMSLVQRFEFKIKTPDDFDKFVCAEIPSSENGYLREIVIKHLMLGPCGHLNPE